MNILYINHYAGSPIHGMEYRPYYLAREWVRGGHSVTIVAASESHLRSRRPSTLGPVTEEIIDGIRYVWLKTPAYSGNTARRVLNMFSFVVNLFRYAKYVMNGQKPDIVIASSTYPLDIYPSAFFAKKYGSKLIFEVHDLWPLSPIELGGMSRLHPFIIPIQWAEDYAYNRADRVISMLPKAAPYMESRGMSPEKFIYVPNGVDVSEWSNEGRLPTEFSNIIRQKRIKGHFLIGYAGSHGVANALHNLLHAASCLRTCPVTFLLVGKGPEKTQLQCLANELGLDNVIFLPSLDKAAIPAFLEQMDALYIGWNHNSLYRFGISPNKLMDYMMAGKPVLHAVDAGNDPVMEAQCGFSVPPEDPGALAKAVEKLIQLNSEHRNELGQNGRDFVRSRHDYRVLARHFIEAVS